MRRDWAVFRCSGGMTLDLEADMARRGIEAYAPSVMIKRRVPRTNRSEWVTIPVLPTFIFVRMTDLEQARGVVGRDGSEMLFNGAAVAIPDSQIKEMSDYVNARIAKFELRGHKKRFTRAQDRPIELPKHSFNPGDPVEVNSGPFKGIGGQVLKVHKEDIEIEFGGFLGKVRISTFLLSPKGV